MRENRPYGSEGGEARAFPTPIDCRNAKNPCLFGEFAILDDGFRHP